MPEKELSKKKRNISILLKVNLTVAVCGILLLLSSTYLLTKYIMFVEQKLMSDRLASEIRYLRDYLGEQEGADWELREDGLYIGDTFIGDGTITNANEAPFIHCEAVTGSLFYVFIKTDNDSELGWVKEGRYKQGHYLRVAGSTRGTHREQIEGTYMQKKAADALDASPNGSYTAVTNVNGRKIYCHYELLKDASGQVIGVISNGRDIHELYEITRKQRIQACLIDLVLIFLLLSALGGIVYSILHSVEKIRHQLAVIGTGEFPEAPLQLNSRDELQEVADSINDMVLHLKENERIVTELSLATDIQAQMLPRIFPPFPDHTEFDIYASMEPAKEVGGDFYDFFMLDDKRVAVVIADVSGKGVPAALVMVITKALIKNYVQMGLSPAVAFTTVNQLLCDDNESSMFVTAWMGILDTTTGELTFVNAGHNPPLILQRENPEKDRAGEPEFRYLKVRPGLVLAGMEGIRYRQNTLQMTPGDRLFLYTDGVTEAVDPDEKMYGEERLETYLNAHKDEPIKDLITGIRSDVAAFARGEEQFDDITMLILEYREKRKETIVMTEKVFDAELKDLPDMAAFLEEQLEMMGCPMKVQMKIQLAAEELFVNVASYAYEGKKGTVRYSIGPDEEKTGMILRISDYGLPFNPLIHKDPDVTLKAEDRKIGGLGIYMVKKNIDVVEYEYADLQNIVTLKTKF